MASPLPDIVQFFIDQIEGIGELRARRMFGGTSVYCDEQIIALEAYGEMYLKVDDLNRPQFEALGSGPFVFESKDGKKAPMPYYRVPDDYLEDRDKLLPLVGTAVQAAARAKKK